MVVFPSPGGPLRSKIFRKAGSSAALGFTAAFLDAEGKTIGSQFFNQRRTCLCVLSSPRRSVNRFARYFSLQSKVFPVLGSTLVELIKALIASDWTGGFRDILLSSILASC